jgi:multiple sugar transport system substrate-binding protein
MNISRRTLLKSGVALGAIGAAGWNTRLLAQDVQTIRVSIWAQWADLYRQLADIFEAANPGIKVAIETAPFDNYHDRLLTRFASGDVPDVAMIVDFDFYRFQSRGFLRNLDAMVDASGQFDRSKPGMGRFYPAAANFFAPGGSVFALPLEVNPMGVEFNIDVFKAAGVPTPYEQWKAGTWTWDAFVDTAKKLTTGEGSSRIYGYAEGSADIWNLACRVWANGGQYFNPERTEILLDQPAAYEAIQWYFDLFLKHGVTPANLRSADGNTGNWFPQGKAAMGFATTWVRLENKDAPFAWGVAPFPKAVKEASWTGGFSFAIPERAKNADLAWKFVEFATTVDSSKFLLRNGAPGSAVVEAMNSDAFLYEPPQHSETYLHMLETAEPQPFITRTAEFRDIHNREMDLVAIGEKSAKDATKTIAEETRPLLAG